MSRRPRPSAYGVTVTGLVPEERASGRRSLRVYWTGVNGPGNALMYPSVNTEGVRVGEVCDVVRNGNGRILALRRPTDDRKRTFEGEVLIEVEMAGDTDAAFAAIDAIMQAAWDRTQGGTTIGGPTWHFTMLDGAISDVTEEASDD